MRLVAGEFSRPVVAGAPSPPVAEDDKSSANMCPITFSRRLLDVTPFRKANPSNIGSTGRPSGSDYLRRDPWTPLSVEGRDLRRNYLWSLFVSDAGVWETSAAMLERDCRWQTVRFHLLRRSCMWQTVRGNVSGSGVIVSRCTADCCGEIRSARGRGFLAPYLTVTV